MAEKRKQKEEKARLDKIQQLREAGEEEKAQQLEKSIKDKKKALEEVEAAR